MTGTPTVEKLSAMACNYPLLICYWSFFGAGPGWVRVMVSSVRM